MTFGVPLRWVAIFVFMLTNTLSFLDRQLLVAVAPSLRAEFELNNAQIGLLGTAFSIPYALSAPLAGFLIDRAGLNRGISAALSLWSLAGIATGLSSAYAGLVACRAALGVAESANIPSSGKAVAMYLQPRERALGSATGQLGITLGSTGATLLAGLLAPRYGWRAPFLIAGLLGFLWIPLWWFVARRVPANPVSPHKPAPLARDRRVYGLILGAMFGMAVYSLWTNWTTVFFVEVFHLSERDANLRLAWMPPVFASLGALSGGALSYRLAGATSAFASARLRAILVAACASLVTAAIPHLPSPGWAVAAICWSFFWAASLSANLYALPIDLFGPERAASGVAALTFAYGAMQSALFYGAGWMIDRSGFDALCAIVALCPLAAWTLLRWTASLPATPAPPPLSP
jgi:ACS family hexuronate transporter-like MFS transporter